MTKGLTFQEQLGGPGSFKRVSDLLRRSSWTEKRGWQTYIDLNLGSIRVFDSGIITFNPLIVHELSYSMVRFFSHKTDIASRRLTCQTTLAYTTCKIGEDGQLSAHVMQGGSGLGIHGPAPSTTT